MSTSRIHSFLPAVLAAVLLTGCSTVVNSHLQKQEMMQAYMAGNNAGAMAEISEKLKEPAWYNSSVVNTGDELMWRLEAGSLNFHNGAFAQAINEFRTAEELIYSYDERSKVSVRDVSSEAASAVTNLNALPYKGFCRDRIALAFYKALAYLGNGKEDSFRAQIRRLRDEQKKVQEDYKAFFEKEEAEMKKQREENPEVSTQTDEKASITNITGNAKNQDFTNALNTTRSIANKGYGNFLNPAAIFLSGLGNIRDGKYDNARIDFQRIYEAMPANPLAQAYYVTVLQKAEREIPAPLAAVKPFGFPLDHDCVYVIFAHSRGPAFKQCAIYFPIMTAWPVCEFYSAAFSHLTAKADGIDYSTQPLADMDGIIAQEYDERLPGMVTRIVFSTLVKEAAYAAALVAARESTRGNSTAQLIAVGAVALGGAAYRGAMNTADTRSWETLPKEFQLTQFPMPKDRKVTLRLVGRNIVNKTLEIPQSCRSAIIFVDAPCAGNTTIHTLPLTSR